ncbi:hypothetical protein BN970_05176 [Mycolicibacterium conceptionense]|uniref:Uncharacterized protein n=1 Tax=Mycolicibacterium conceptionense TaxID=451644 RepID=A0A0U1DSD6_9MYCO|nr:hypothetical protein BN970_05176 [Mycolicibacterium conceptionense]
MLDPESDRRRHRLVIGGRDPDIGTAVFPHQPVGVLTNFHLRRAGEVGMVGDAVADGVPESAQRRLDHLCGSGRADDRQRRCVRGERAHPAGDDHIAQVGDVIAVQMGQQQCAELVGAGTDRGQALQHSAAAVDEKHLVARAHQG